MGYGTPSIITTAGGGKEVIENNVTGIIVPTNDATAIADKIRILYSEPQLIAAMSKQCKETLANKYSSELTVDGFVNYFEKIIT